MTRPARSLSTLRREGRPSATQDSLPAVGRTLPGGIGYPLDSYAKGFSSMSSQHGFPLSQAFPGARAIQFSAYGIRPPRRHGGTENGHGGGFVSRATLRDLEAWGMRELTAIRARQTPTSSTPEPAAMGRFVGERRDDVPCGGGELGARGFNARPTSDA